MPDGHGAASRAATMTVRVRVVGDRPDADGSLASALNSGGISTDSSTLDDLLSQPGGTGEIVVLDLAAAPDDLAAAAVTVRTHVKGPVIVIIDEIREASLLAVLAAGANGVVLRASDAEVIEDAARAAHGGGVFIDPVLGATLIEVVSVMFRADLDTVLTPTELRVLQRFPRGLTNAEIAQDLGVTVNTVKTHVRHILGKLECRDRLEAVQVAEERGLLS